MSTVKMTSPRMRFMLIPEGTEDTHRAPQIMRIPPEPLSGALFFAPPAPPAPAPNAAREKPAREKRPKAKNDPKLVRAARELRDRYLEHVNNDPHALRAVGKYAVSRLPDAGPVHERVALLLPAA